MDNNYEKNENIENESERAEETSIPETEWTSVKRHSSTKPKAEPSIKPQTETVPEPDIMPDPIEEPTLEVLSDDAFETVNDFSDIEGRSTKEMQKSSKQARKEARKELKQTTADLKGEESFFKTKAWKSLWSVICLVLLIISIGLPVCLLIYIITRFFI